ncbi:MAG TPA: hypothetical protein VMH27_04920 [Puia sp.]|nr:hypothetical protein [Puia sp.]
MNLDFKQLNALVGFAAAALITFVSCRSGQKEDIPRVCRTGADIPHMWVGDSTSDTDENHFLGYIPEINSHLGANQNETDSIYYTLGEFQAMVDSIRKIPNVQFVRICPVVNPATSRLSVVYVPEDGSCTPLTYFWLPENRSTFPESGDVLSAAVFKTWQDLYINTIVRWLNSKLDQTDPANYVDGDTSGKLLNTLHAAHYFTDIKELYDEIDRQKANQISGIEAMFAAKATLASPTPFGFSNRLYVMLEFTKDEAATGKHKKFRIDTCGRHYNGPTSMIDACGFGQQFIAKRKVLLDSANKGGNDNGQLCPPACNP